MKHDLVYVSDDATDVLFKCTRCPAVIGFNKPGVGHPCPVKSGGVWMPNPDYMEYMDPCTGSPPDPQE